jgi:hypothetical protein
LAERERFLAVEAGPFRVALALRAVRQILDVGNGDAILDPRALGVTPFSMARLLGADDASARPAVLLLESTSALRAGPAEPVVLTCCRLHGVVDAAMPTPLPRTVACRWPGLLRGTIDARGNAGGDASGDLLLVLDDVVLMGLIESQPGDAP